MICTSELKAVPGYSCCNRRRRVHGHGRGQPILDRRGLPILGRRGDCCRGVGGCGIRAGGTLPSEMSNKVRT